MRRTAVLLGVSVIALAAVLPARASARAETGSAAKRVASIAILTTLDFRVALVAHRLGAGAAPTAEVRIAVARRVGGGWRERSELRLRETYFWHTLTGPRSVCRLEVATTSSRSRGGPHVVFQLLRSPALGCGPTHRLSLPSR